MKIIENKLNDTLQKNLYDNIEPEAEVNICTGAISIYAIYFLREKLEISKNINILLLGNNNMTPNDNAQNSIWGITEENELKRRLNLRYIAQDCASIIKTNTHIKKTTPETLGLKFIHIKNKLGNELAINTNTFNMTSDNLGILHSDSPKMYMLLSEEAEMQSIKVFGETFSETWKKEKNDITQKTLEELAKGYKDYAPSEVYYYILHHIFHDAIKNLTDSRQLKKVTELKDTEVWKKLYKFQKDGVLGAIDKIEKYGGCIIADSVGLGKTFEALAVIKYYELRNDRVLVLCPKKLRGNWTDYNGNDAKNIFVNDGFHYDVLNHTDLTRSKGKSGDIDLKTLNWGNYDLVVIDESHNFRNNNPKKDVKTRYNKLMDDIIKQGVKTHLLMLSATPVNNRMNDLKNQIVFITEGDDKAYEEEGIENISSVMKLAQTQFSAWSKCGDRDINSLFDCLDNRYFKLLDMLTIARSRKHISKYYSKGDVGKFPERLIPINEKTNISSDPGFKSMAEINDAIRSLKLANFSPMAYLLPEKKQEYEEKYDYKLNSGSVFKQIDRENSLICLMRVNYLKRMESSINSFSISIKKLLNQVDIDLNKIDNAENYIDESIRIEDIDEDDDLESLIGNKVKVLLQDIDRIRWQQDLERDKKVLEHLLQYSTSVKASNDEKLKKLKELIKNKIENPINPGNKKVIVFTAFADTAKYLYEELAEWELKTFGLYSAMITGSIPNKTNFPHSSNDMGELISHFSPISKFRNKTYPNAKGEINLLIATDCISEGQNLQDCDYLVNFDIHWNPVRIIQRFGRIDRLGSLNSKIQLVNFWPNMELNEYINLENRVKGRMVLLDISATGEENVIEPNEKNDMNDLEYRKKQMEQLLKEVPDMEDIKGGITITDSNMNDFRMDLLDYEKENQKELQGIPMGIHTIVKINDDDTKPGTIFCLRSINEQKGKSLLSPYFMVYIGEDGNTLLGYTQGKRCLDYLKRLCQNETEPLEELCKEVKQETHNYSNMTKYSNGLQQAIDSVLGKAQEVGAAAFFSTNPIALNAEGVNARSDFDIVAFVIVKAE